MGDTLVLVTTHVSTSHAHQRPSRRVLRAAALTSAVALSLLAAPARADVPEGWQVVYGEADRAACLDYIEQNWPDIRPKSLRERLEGRA